MKYPKTVAVIWAPLAISVVIVATAIFFWPTPNVETLVTGGWAATCTNVKVTADCLKGDGSTNHNVDFDAHACAKGMNNLNGSLKCA